MAKTDYYLGLSSVTAPLRDRLEGACPGIGVSFCLFRRSFCLAGLSFRLIHVTRCLESQS